MSVISLQENEVIISIVRKHWIVLLGQFIAHIFLAIIPVIGFIIIQPLLGFELTTAGYKIATIIGLVYWLSLWISFFIFWTDYILDAWVITNQRLIDIEQLGLFNRRISTLSLDKVQDITTHQAGILDSVLHIGTISIQTAGAVHEFKIPDAPNPESIKTTIMQAMQHTKTTTL